MYDDKTNSQLIDVWMGLYKSIYQYPNMAEPLERVKVVKVEEELRAREINVSDLREYALKAQKVKIIKHKDRSKLRRYEADPIDQPGSPRIGIGQTPYLALKDLLMNNESFNIHLIDETGELQ